eukprot:5801398-Amphidinium_carterae.1
MQGHTTSRTGRKQTFKLPFLNITGEVQSSHMATPHLPPTPRCRGSGAPTLTQEQPNSYSAVADTPS